MDSSDERDSREDSRKSQAARDRLPLHVRKPLPNVPKPIAPGLERANAVLRNRIEKLAASRHRHESKVSEAHTARCNHMREAIDALDSKMYHENRVAEALRTWRTQQSESLHEKTTKLTAEALTRHQAISSRGQDVVAQLDNGPTPPSTPRRLATYKRFDRLLAPLPNADEAQEVLTARMAAFFDSKLKLEARRQSQQESRRSQRSVREQLALERVAEQEALARAHHEKKLLRSEAACYRAARTKARVRNPRRALAEDRWEQREAARVADMLGTSMRTPRYAVSHDSDAAAKIPMPPPAARPQE